MINFVDPSGEKPFEIIHNLYNLALAAKQKNINAIAISSFNSEKKEVDSRFVNLKFIKDNQLIFFTNYNSPKSIAFKSHPQITALLYWSSINVQIRMKAKLKKTSKEYNQEYFFNRSKEKNALAISSNQSKRIDSFNKVKMNFKKSLKHDDLKKCPKYWGGYAFIPYEIEFWEGNESRLNKRDLYKKDNDKWNHYILEP